MSTLDSPNVVDQNAVSFWPTVTRYGLIGGLVFVIYGLLGNLLGFAKPSAGFTALIINGLVAIALYVGLLVLAIRKHRDEELGGYITFGRAFIVGFLVALISGVVGAIFNMVYTQFIDPNYLTDMIGEMEEMYQRLGMNEDQIETALEALKDGFRPTKMLTTGLLYTGIMGAIVAAIVGAVMKKKAPEFT